jgi:3-oxoacyl-[acyl-carrier-protein] synthase II
LSKTTVVVTGLGTTNPVGGDVPSTWAALLAGRSGVGVLEHAWAEQLPVRIAAEVSVEPADVLERVRARRLDRSSQHAVIAATEAWADSGLADAPPDPERVGVAMASGIGGVTTLLSNYDALLEKGPRRVSPLAIPMLMPNGPAASVGLMVDAKAGVHTPVSACASGNEAIALGIDMIRLGRADVVVVGGTEAAVHPLPMAAFANMMALSKRNDAPTAASRPWDLGRDGFVLGEGAGVLVLESQEHAAARGARVYAVAAGAGITADSHDIAQPDPAGAGAARAIVRALSEADLSPTDIRHVNAHATSTPLGDVAEATALRATLGQATDDIVVTATKSMTGHLLGAAGALESTDGTQP